MVIAQACECLALRRFWLLRKLRSRKVAQQRVETEASAIDLLQQRKVAKHLRYLRCLGFWDTQRGANFPEEKIPGKKGAESTEAFPSRLVQRVFETDIEARVQAAVGDPKSYPALLCFELTNEICNFEPRIPRFLSNAFAGNLDGQWQITKQLQ
jgi:hypothetical protein